jgi:hypothetical protein
MPLSSEWSLFLGLSHWNLEHFFLLSHACHMLNFNFQLLTTFIFLVFYTKHLFILSRSINIQNPMVPHWLVQVLHPSQKLERLSSWYSWHCGIKKWFWGHLQWHALPTKFYGNLPTGSEVVTEEQTCRQEGNLISLLFSFTKEIWLKIMYNVQTILIHSHCPALILLSYSSDDLAYRPAYQDWSKNLVSYNMRLIHTIHTIKILLYCFRK